LFERSTAFIISNLSVLSNFVPLAQEFKIPNVNLNFAYSVSTPSFFDSDRLSPSEKYEAWPFLEEKTTGWPFSILRVLDKNWDITFLPLEYWG